MKNLEENLISRNAHEEMIIDKLNLKPKDMKKMKTINIKCKN